MKKKWKKWKKWKYLRWLFLLLSIAYYFSISDKIFEDPYSTILEDRKGELLSASIATDGQWRFPEIDTLPSKFAEAITLYEDKRFYSHPGIDFLSMGRAFKQNINAGEIVSGGSTITMQVVRLSRKGKSRSVFEKIIEAILATRLELRYQKQRLLAMYASHAPFGGNVVGIEAACWRYFGKSEKELSWSEAALLAVLPNAPSLIHPGKNREMLKAKRNRLLERIRDAGKIDSLDCDLAKAELIPQHPTPLPHYARHLLVRAMKEGYGQQRIRSTLQLTLQQRVEQIVDDHHQRLKGNHVFNAAALVMDVQTGEVLAYVGNTTVKENGQHGDEVDVITAPRSTGSILKPFLYAAMLNEGRMLPKTLWPDIPTLINGFTPKNFSKDYDGAVHADKALIRSLNIPAVHMLRNFRYEKFHSLLQNLGMTTLTNSPDHYGLSLILGGAEGTLWDITGMYASMSRSLNHYFEHPGGNSYYKQDYHSPTYLLTKKQKATITPEAMSQLSAASIYQTFDVLKEVYRPGEETGWKHFSSSKKIAWKTGTSFGSRDGWAVGTNPVYTVGIWTGNADGEGRAGLTGTEAAAPILFDIFSQLPDQSWFQPPGREMETAIVCAESGCRVGEWCPKRDTVSIARSGLSSPQCVFHKGVHLSKDTKFRVHSECEAIENIHTTSWFVLPPIQAYYFRMKNISYKALPPFKRGCQPQAMGGMDLIYPKFNAKIFIPRELDGQTGSTLFELAHSNPSATVYWHLDGAYIGTTRKKHLLPLQPETGKHLLTLVDESGEVLEQTFEVVSK